MRKLKTGLRVYLDKEGVWNRFGYDIQTTKINSILQLLGNKISGFHFHFSTNNFDLDNYKLILTEINNLVVKFNLKLDYLDIGGGLPGRQELMYKDKIEEIPALLSKFFKNISIISEVGRFLTEDTFDLEANVISVKNKSAGEWDISVDTNIMHFPCFWEKKFSLTYLSKGKKQNICSLNIFGNSCMQVDKLCDKMLSNYEPQVGDKLIIRNVGAYSVSQASNFITNIPQIEVK